MYVTGIGQRIIRLRENKNISQIELAKQIDVNKSVMNRIESEERPIRDYELHKIASILETTSDYLLGREMNEEGSIYQLPNYIEGAVNTLGLHSFSLQELKRLNALDEADKLEINHFIKFVLYRADQKNKK